MRKHHGTIKRVCQHCGKNFTISVSRAKDGRGKYCSRKCFLEVCRTEKHSPRICENCEDEFTARYSEIKRGGARFCSVDCSVEYQRGENSPSWKGGNPKRLCKVCGKEFDTPRFQIKKGRGIFCSTECMHQLYRGENHPLWKGGKTEWKKKENVNKRKKKHHKAKPIPKPIRKRPGQIYILLADNGLYKIGRTKKLDKRIRDLGIQLPYELELIMLAEAEDMFATEHKFHKYFAKKRVRGEWFGLDKGDLEYIKKFMLGVAG